MYDFHNHMNLNAMTGKTSLRAFQRAAGCCEAVCGQMIYWPSSSQLKVLWAVGGTGFLAVIREVRSPQGADVKSGYFDINKSGTAEGSFRLLGETGAFSFIRSCHIHL